MYTDLFKNNFPNVCFVRFFICFVLIRYVELASFRNSRGDRNNGSYRSTFSGEIVLCYRDLIKGSKNIWGFHKVKQNNRFV